jgi:hypothetical protein
VTIPLGRKQTHWLDDPFGLDDPDSRDGEEAQP